MSELRVSDEERRLKREYGWVYIFVSFHIKLTLKLSRQLECIKLKSRL